MFGVLYKTINFKNEKALYLIFSSMFITNVRYSLFEWGRAKNLCIYILISHGPGQNVKLYLGCV